MDPREPPRHARIASLPLPCWTAGSEALPNDRLVPEEGVLDPALSVVPRLLLPPSSPATGRRGLRGAWLDVAGATVVSTHETASAAFAALDRIAEKLQQNGVADGALEIHVVDDDRQPVTRRGQTSVVSQK